LPPVVISVSPVHGSVADWDCCSGQVSAKLKFDRDMHSTIVTKVRFDGNSAGFECASPTCSELVLTLERASVIDGIHTIDIDEGAEAQDGSSMFAAFHSMFVVSRQPNIISDHSAHAQEGLICGDFNQLCHNAAGALWFRAKNVGSDWSSWQSFSAFSDWQSEPGVGVLVQYHAQVSASYVVGDCKTLKNATCYTSWHSKMFLRGDWNDWGMSDSGRMRLKGDFTWAANITVDGFQRAKFAPAAGWSKAYGNHAPRPLWYGLPFYDSRARNFNAEPYMSGTEAVRQWMLQRGNWNEHESVASGAEWSSHLWVSHLQCGAACLSACSR